MIEAEEDIARAICSHQWDAETGEMSASLFKGAGTSVSRLAITPLEDTWDLFRREVEQPPERLLKRIGTINVGHLQEIGRACANAPTELTVAARPEPGYPSHAEIPQKISRGLANTIIRNLKAETEAA